LEATLLSSDAKIPKETDRCVLYAKRVSGVNGFNFRCQDGIVHKLSVVP
jgi:hypothetical protein